MYSKIRLRRHFTIGLISLALFPVSANAAQVTFAGVINDNAGSQITNWKTAATNKTLDADGDNVYGTLAHIFHGVEFKGGGSIYQMDSSDIQVGPYPGYAVVDHPAGNGTTPVDIQVLTTTNGGVNDVDHVMFTFTALAGSPAYVRIGVATDGLNGGNYSPASIGLRQVGGGGASVEHTMTSINATPDMVFFDVTGVSVGDQFQVFGDSGAGGFATHQFVTWDALPPSYTWGGSTSTWTDTSATGWNGGVPLAGDRATINSGRVNFAGHDTFGNVGTTTSASINLNGGTLASNGFFTTIWNLNLNGGTLLANGGANPDYPAFQLAGTVTVGGGQVSTIDATTAVNANNQINIGGNGNSTLGFNVADVTADANPDLIINAILKNSNSGACGLTKSGTGTLSLAGANTFSGPITVDGGRLNVPDGLSLKSTNGAITVLSGAAFNFYQNYTGDNLTNALILSGAGDGGIGAFNLGANAVATGSITLNADATISHDWSNGTISGPVTGANKNLTLASTVAGQGSLIVNGNITLGSGTLTKTGANSIDLAGTNSWGAMVIEKGAVYFRNSAAMGGTGANITIGTDGVALLDGAAISTILSRVNTASSGAIAFSSSSAQSIDLTNHPSLSVGAQVSMALSGTITPGGGSYRLGGGGGTLTVNSALSGSSGLVVSDKLGGTILLSGGHTYSGPTTVTAGTLQVDGSLSGAVTVASADTRRGQRHRQPHAGFTAHRSWQTQFSHGSFECSNRRPHHRPVIGTDRRLVREQHRPRSPGGRQLQAVRHQRQFHAESGEI